MGNTSARLLVVDDAPEMGLIVERLGRRSGLQVSSCPSVPAAWDFLSHTRPDLLVIDVNLPGENGLVLCRRVRSAPHLARLPIALFSLWDRPGDIAAGLQAGSDFVLSKALLCQPERRQQRVSELLTHSQPYSCSLSWTKSADVEFVVGWVEAVNQVLRYQAQRQLGLDVLTVLVRRAVERIGSEHPPPRLLPDGLGLDPSQVTRAGGAEMVQGFTVSLANQFWCVLGSIEGTALLRGLARAVPPLAELLTPQ